MLAIVLMEKLTGRLLRFYKLKKKQTSFYYQKIILVKESLEIIKHNSVFNDYNDPQLVVNTLVVEYSI